jgi:hypothetical protein
MNVRLGKEVKKKDGSWEACAESQQNMASRKEDLYYRKARLSQ